MLRRSGRGAAGGGAAGGGGLLVRTSGHFFFLSLGPSFTFWVQPESPLRSIPEKTLRNLRKFSGNEPQENLKGSSRKPQVRRPGYPQVIHSLWKTIHNLWKSCGKPFLKTTSSPGPSGPGLS
jgi:hypothetical protein